MSSEIIIEIHAGEGGEDSRLFIHDLLSVYVKYAKSKALRAEILSSSKGDIVAKITGGGAGRYFQHESGKHCCQRVPPTETKGRRQTSMISVAVLSVPPKGDIKPISESEFDIKFQVGSGPGGQHRNRTASAVRMVHKKTGLSIFIDGRDQHSNKREALRVLTAKVRQQESAKDHAERASNKKSQMGGGGRSDKVRTYNFCDSRVKDHRLGTQTRNIKAVMNGNLDLILEKK